MSQVFCHHSPTTAPAPARPGDGGPHPTCRGLHGDGRRFGNHPDFSFLPLNRCLSLEERPANSFALQECPRLTRQNSDGQWVLLPGGTATRAVGHVPAVRLETPFLRLDGEQNISGTDPQAAFSPRFFLPQQTCTYSGSSCQALSTPADPSSKSLVSPINADVGTPRLMLKRPTCTASARGAFSEGIGVNAPGRASIGGGNVPAAFFRGQVSSAQKLVPGSPDPSSFVGRLDPCGAPRGSTYSDCHSISPGILPSPRAPPPFSCTGEMGTSLAFAPFVSWWGKDRYDGGEKPPPSAASVTPRLSTYSLEAGGASLTPRDYKDDTIKAYLRQNYGSAGPIVFASPDYPEGRSSGPLPPCHALGGAIPFGSLFDRANVERHSTPRAHWVKEPMAGHLPDDGVQVRSSSVTAALPDLNGLYTYYMSTKGGDRATSGTPVNSGNAVSSQKGVIFSEQGPIGGLPVTTRLLPTSVIGQKSLCDVGRRPVNAGSSPPLSNPGHPCSSLSTGGKETVGATDALHATALRKVLRTEAAEVLASTGTYEGRHVVLEKTPSTTVTGVAAVPPLLASSSFSRIGSSSRSTTHRDAAETAGLNIRSLKCLSSAKKGGLPVVQSSYSQELAFRSPDSARRVVLLSPNSIAYQEKGDDMSSRDPPATQATRRLGFQQAKGYLLSPDIPPPPTIMPQNNSNNVPETPSSQAGGTPARGRSSETTASTTSVSSSLTRQSGGRALTSGAAAFCAPIKSTPRMLTRASGVPLYPRGAGALCTTPRQSPPAEIDNRGTSLFFSSSSSSCSLKVQIDQHQQKQLQQEERMTTMISDESMIMQVWKISLCGRKAMLVENKHVLGIRGQRAASAGWSREAVRVNAQEHHREFVFYFPSREVIPRDELKILSAISQGSFGTVFRCQWKDRIVAVKQAHGPFTLEAMRSVARELNTFRALGDHPLIVRYYGVCLNLGFLGIVMEYLPGPSIFDMLYHDKAFVQAEIRLNLCRKLVSAVHFMHHEKRLVHRDLKTANLILEGTDGLRLCDFGKTRSLGADGKLLLDDNGGSPRYMAPECFLKDTMIDEKADIWGLGCCLVELLGGPIPFEEIQTNEAVIDAVLCKKLRPMVPSWFHPTAQRLLARCFAQAPRDRPSTKEVAQTLDILSASDLSMYGMHIRRTK
ncbi:tyrosine kinase-like [Cystoisospora suis]|uniref:Tyrosine kinase-like n=1 Tax=Cystoisospora suis TaxID=483139 RepID=A0A2C6KL48_9APIC|nr:tyrosine kinase-like [Cystoisospora suis]